MVRSVERLRDERSQIDIWTSRMIDFHGRGECLRRFCGQKGYVNLD